MPVSQLGGGGCPAYDILVEDLPFDFLQPPMQRGLTQAGYGGPFVIRSNPIGAIFDAIRGFCFPAAMQASSDGSQYSDLSGSGLDTFGGYTQQDLGNLGGGYATGNNPYTNTGGYCGSGTTFDAGSQMCVPTANAPTAAPMVNPSGPNCMASCDPACLEYWNQQRTDACSNRDAARLTAIAAYAGGCALATVGNPMLSNAWKKLGSDSTIFAGRIVKGLECDGTKITKPVTPTPPPTPTPPAPPATGGTGTGNPTSGNTPTGPFDYIGASQTGMGKVDNNPMTVVNPPPTTPTTIAAANARQRLPRVPDFTSLTEGNIYMRPSAEPLGGSFDPSRAQPPLNSRVQRRSFSQRMMFRR